MGAYIRIPSLVPPSVSITILGAGFLSPELEFEGGQLVYVKGKVDSVNQSAGSSGNGKRTGPHRGAQASAAGRSAATRRPKGCEEQGCGEYRPDPSCSER